MDSLSMDSLSVNSSIGYQSIEQMQKQLIQNRYLLHLNDYPFQQIFSH